jgi:hypothetical protein
LERLITEYPNLYICNLKVVSGRALGKWSTAVSVIGLISGIAMGSHLGIDPYSALVGSAPSEPQTRFISRGEVDKVPEG